METLFSRKGSLSEIVVPAEKRISTPAGHRLSTVMDHRPPIPPRSTLRKNALGDIDESTGGSVAGSNGQSYSTVWSDAQSLFRRDEKLDALRSNRHITRRGGWGRVCLIIAIVIAGIIALAVGLAVGLKSKGSSSHSSSSSEDSSSGNSNSGSTATKTSGSSSSATSAAGANFPAGSYAFTTFLDTVQTGCANNSDTWTCYPYTIYNDDKAAAMTTFQWIISGSDGNYTISSTNNPLSVTFSDVDLTLYSKGQDSERYTFQTTMNKKVVPSAAITDDDSSAVCFFNSTTFTAYLYTKMEKAYPTSSESNSTDSTYQAWPYAVRVEESIAGGDNVPNCYKTTNGRIGERITDGMEAQGATTLCSCLYRNYLSKE